MGRRTPSVTLAATMTDTQRRSLSIDSGYERDVRLPLTSPTPTTLIIKKRSESENRRSRWRGRRICARTVRNFLISLICLVCVGCTAIVVYRMANLEAQFLASEQRWRRLDGLKTFFLDLVSEHQTVSTPLPRGPRVPPGSESIHIT